MTHLFMSHRSFGTACLFLATLASPVFAAVAPEQAELAERILLTGQRLVPAQHGTPVAMALADAAERLFENDPRLLREAIDLRLSLNQRDAAIKLLTMYRRLDPADQLAQVQSVDLIADTMETADQKADYLSKVMASSAVPAEVRSHAALLLVGVESQRGRDDEAATALASALQLDPLNRRALQLQLDEVTRTGTAPQQTKALVNLLLAEPMQFGCYSRLAEALTRVGATSQAIDIYSQLFGVLDTTDYLPTPDDSFNYAALLLASNKPKDAQTIVQNALKVDPRPARAHYLRILCAWQANDPADAKSSIDAARQQLLRNLMALQVALDPANAKMDDKTPVALPDVATAVRLLQAKNNPRSTEVYLQELGDLAWLDAYFGNRVPDAAVTSAIETLGGSDNALANRIAGFAAIAAGHDDEAKVKLSAVAEHDPLSQLGLLVLQLKAGADKSSILTDGNSLLAKLPTDVWSAMVRWSLRDAGSLTLHTSDTETVIAEAAKLPREWINFTRDGRQFYFTTVDVVKANVQIGEPMLVTVSIQNASDWPLTIGGGGAIEPRVALDANVRGALERPFPGVAVAKLTGKLILKPREQTRTTVRLDDADLDGFSAANPQTGMSIFASAVTNPVVRGRAIAPGPGGFRAQARDVINRSPTPYAHDDVRARLASQLRSNDALERLHAVATIGACATWVSNGSDEEKPFAADAIEKLQQAADRDASPTVRAIAWQQLALQQDDEARLKSVQTMLTSADTETRLIGCIMSMNRPLGDRKTLLSPLAKDGDEVIAHLAQAILDLPEAPAPASQPLATQP